MFLTKSSPEFYIEKNKSKEITSQFIYVQLGKISSISILEEVLVLLRLSQILEKDFKFTLDDICNKLDVDSEDIFLHLDFIAYDILTNGGENLGRIAVLYALAARLAVKCYKSTNEPVVEHLILWLSTLMATKPSLMHESGKRWDGLINQFIESPNKPRAYRWPMILLVVTAMCGTLATYILIKNW